MSQNVPTMDRPTVEAVISVMWRAMSPLAQSRMVLTVTDAQGVALDFPTPAATSSTEPAEPASSTPK